MLLDRVIRAWKDPEYRQSLSTEEQAQLPENPAGAIELSDDELEMAAGGHGPSYNSSSSSASSISSSSSRYPSSNSSRNSSNNSSNNSSRRPSDKSSRRPSNSQSNRARPSHSWRGPRR